MDFSKKREKCGYKTQVGEIHPRTAQPRTYTSYAKANRMVLGFERGNRDCLSACSRDFSARDSCKHPRSIFLCLTNLLKKRKRIQRQENGSILSRTPSWTPATKTTSVPAKTGKRTRAKPFGHIDVDHHETNDRANQQPRKKLLGQSDTNEDCSASG